MADQFLNQQNLRSKGKLFGWITFLIVIVIALIAFFAYRKAPEMPGGNGLSDIAPVEQGFGVSDEVSSIETDLEGISIDDLDSELQSIEAELAQ